MFKKLFIAVDEFIDKFKDITQIEEMSKVTINILQIIKESLCENLSPNMNKLKRFEIGHECLRDNMEYYMTSYNRSALQ